MIYADPASTRLEIAASRWWLCISDEAYPLWRQMANSVRSQLLGANAVLSGDDRDTAHWLYEILSERIDAHARREIDALVAKVGPQPGPEVSRHV